MEKETQTNSEVVKVHQYGGSAVGGETSHYIVLTFSDGTKKEFKCSKLLKLN